MFEVRQRSFRLRVHAACFLGLICLGADRCAIAQQAGSQQAAKAPLFTEAEKNLAAKLMAMPVADALKAIADEDQAHMTGGLYQAFRAAGNDAYKRDPQRSVVISQEAEAVATRAGLPILAADARSMEGAGMIPNGPLDGAAEALEQAIAMYKAAGAPPAKTASVYLSRSAIRSTLGDSSGAVDDATEGRRILKEAGDEVGVARADNALGTLYRQQAEYSKAESSFEEALRIARAHGETLGEAFVLNNLSSVYANEGDLPRAIQTCEASLKIKRSLGDKAVIATSLINLSNFLHQGNHDAEANKALTEAVQLGRETNRKLVTAKAIAEMGIIQLNSHHPAEALKLMQEGDQLSMDSQDLESHMVNLDRMAEAHFDLNDYETSLKESTEVEGLARSSGDVDELSTAALFAGRAEMALGRLDDARRHLKESIAAVEQMRDHIVGGAHSRQEFLSRRTDPYRYLAHVEALQGNWAAALDQSERGKGRTLLDVYAGNAALSTSSLADAEKKEQERLQSRYLSLSMQTSPGVADGLSGPARRSLDDKLRQAKVDLDTFRNGVYDRHPGLKLRRADIDPVSATDMQAMLPDAGSALLEYENTPEHLYVFVVTRGPEGTAAVKGFGLAVTMPELARHIRRYREQLASRDPEFAVESRWLYDALLKPARELLRGKTSLVLVPDNAIWNVPFQSLQRPDGKYVAEQASISYVPSLGVLHALKTEAAGRHGGHRLFVMGDPGEETPEQTREASALANLYGRGNSRELLGKAATLVQFRTSSPAYDVVHVAAHGIFNDLDPMSSHMVLAAAHGGASAGWLQAREILDMKLHADLVVLSGCETGKGAIEDGEGLIGMSWAVLAAGAHGVVASAWRVEASSTTEMMLAFHAGMLHGTAKGEALRRAQIKLIHTPKYGHPYYWAAFRLTGDGV
jgi:CHAT domain-containing protein